MADDANRDEVDKCKRIAEGALAAGDTEKAIRFLQKAKRMSPGDASLDALLARAESGGGGGPSASPAGGSNAGGATNGTSSGGAAAAAGARHRPSAATTVAGAGAASPSPGSTSSGGGTRVGKDGRTYTTEQMQLVQRILRTKDYYAILELEKEADAEQVKRAYKKVALKLHPDKNKAPGAEEAFKKLSKAVQCLTDEEKKQVYDRYGDEERIPQQQRQHYQQDFMTPEDLFAAFFGGGAFQTTHTHHHHAGNQGEGGGQVQRAHILQMLPVLLLIFLTLASNFATNSGSGRFSFTANSQYKVERNTASLDVPYYVTDDFPDHYAEGTKALAEFERQVEIYYVRNLHSECDYQEKTMYKKVMIAKRRGGQDEELKSARSHPRPACKEIEKIKRSHATIYRAAMYMGMY